MLVTEEQAKEMWCPASAPAMGSASTNCIGSRCMWFRWTTPAFGTILERKPVTANSKCPPGGNYKGDGTGEWVRYEKIAVGFCGMAGKPEVK